MIANANLQHNGLHNISGRTRPVRLPQLQSYVIVMCIKLSESGILLITSSFH